MAGSTSQEIKTAFFGGSFDPPHCGHVMVVAYLLTCTEVQDVFVVPCYRHAFGKVSAPFEHRLEMCRAAFQAFGRKVRVLDVEAALPAPSFTVQTLRYLINKYPKRKFILVVGSDILPETPSWRNWEELTSLAEILVLRREGFEDPPDARGPRFPEVSSTAIRQALTRGEPVAGLVPAAVLKIINNLGLYRAG